MKSLFLFPVVLCCLAVPASAQLYQIADSNGHNTVGVNQERFVQAGQTSNSAFTNSLLSQRPLSGLMQDEAPLPESIFADGSANQGGSSEQGGADPSDPTQVTFHVMQEFEWNNLNQSQGHLISYKVSPFIPLKLGEQNFLANFEVPLTYADTDILGHHTGIGDTRLKFFWLIGTESKFLRAIVPSFDAIAPTGDVDRGLGGGSWILMPNAVFAFQAADNFSIYPFFRYVHSDGPAPFFVPDSGIPIPPGSNVDAVSSKTRAFNMEVMMTFNLENAVMNWVSVTPDYFQNFSGDRGYTFQMKYDTGVALNEQLFLILKMWHPVSGDVTNDFTAGISLDWYPK